MSRLRLALTLTLAGSLGMTAIACGGSAPTPTIAFPTISIPTVSIPPLPSIAIPSIAIPSISIPSIVIPTIPALPSGLPTIPGLPSGVPSFAIPTFHQAPGLEAALPNSIRGVTLEKASLTGDFLLSGGNSGGDEIKAVLAQFGKQPSDLAFASANDPTGSLVFQLIAFTVSGVDGAQLGAALLAVAAASATTKPTTSQATIGGKAVTILVDPDSGQTQYLYPKGEILYDVSGGTSDTPDDQLTADLLAALP